MMDDNERALFLAERAGKLTASRMADAMSFLKNGKPSQKRSDYMRDLIAERLTDYSARHYVTPAMQHGIAYEDEAKMAYEGATGILITDPRTVTPLGVFHHPTIENFAASPDGLIDAEGLLEVKAPTTPTFVEWVIAGVVPEEHKPQMLAQCLCTGRAWVEFVAYDPRLREESKRLFVRRYTPTADELNAVDCAAVQFLDELEAAWQAFITRPLERAA